MKISVTGDPAIYEMILRELNGFWVKVTMEDGRVFDRVHLESSSDDFDAGILCGEDEIGLSFSADYDDIASLEVL
jgi:hypothetical protein